MSPGSTTHAIEALTEGSLTYNELLNLHQELRVASANTPYERISQRAFCQIIGELIEYLHFVEDNLEKAVGLTREAERERVFAQLERPSREDPVEAVSALVQQWEAVDRYTYEDIDAISDQVSTVSTKTRHHVSDRD